MTPQYQTLARVSEAQERALFWLHDAGGSGVIDRYGNIVAAGQAAKWADAGTWLRLIADEFVDGKDKRLQVTFRGKNYVEALREMGLMPHRATGG